MLTRTQLTQLFYPIVISFLICICIGPFVIKLMKRLKFGQQVREDGPQTHLAKQNTPTIGGLIILAGIIGAGVIYRISGIALVAMLVTVAYGVVGFLDV